jgi:hypothetical protein
LDENSLAERLMNRVIHKSWGGGVWALISIENSRTIIEGERYLAAYHHNLFPMAIKTPYRMVFLSG